MTAIIARLPTPDEREAFLVPELADGHIAAAHLAAALVLEATDAIAIDALARDAVRAAMTEIATLAVPARQEAESELLWAWVARLARPAQETTTKGN